jgi:hypothetical protein
LYQLLEKPGFLLALNYRYVKSKNSNYEDVQDGNHFKKHEEQMNKNFDKKRKDDINLIKVNIFISQFYDGVKLYNKKVIDFWPLLFTILNLPPNIRNKMGKGMFLLSMFSNALGSNAENFLFEQCFIAELQLLKEGITYKNFKGESFFVQLRLIQHCMDTKAIGKELRVQEVNSKIGCPLCRGLYGSYRKQLKSTRYGGNRVALPINHFTRVCGQSEKCCPIFYYNKLPTEDEKEKKKKREKVP